MKKFILTLSLFVLAAGTAAAKDEAAVPAPRKVENLTLKTLTGEETKLPHFGEKNLLIFYIDPDLGIFGNANMRFTDEIEESGVTKGDNLFGFGVLNIGDTSLGEKMICKLANKRTQKNNATVLNDPNHLLNTAWKLGDCNGKCVIMIVSKEGELVYLLTDKVTAEDKAEFYKTIEKYR